jgi:hypothetical protein
LHVLPSRLKYALLHIGQPRALKLDSEIADGSLECLDIIRYLFTFCCILPSASLSARTSLPFSPNADRFFSSFTLQEKISSSDTTYIMDIDIIKVDESTTDIAPDGDVIFLIGPEKKRFRTNSLVVKNASKVFAALLGPHFSEDQALSVGKDHGLPVEILLPEDDPEALSVIFKVIHGRNDLILENPKSSTVLKVAIAVDKWDCHIPLCWAISAWLKFGGSIPNVEVLWTLMLAAYWFRHGQGFMNTTRALVMHHDGLYLELSRNTDTWCSRSLTFLMIIPRKSFRNSYPWVKESF